MDGLVLFEARTGVEGEGEWACRKRLAVLSCALHNRLALKWEDDAVELDAVENQEAGETAKNVTECQLAAKMW